MYPDWPESYADLKPLPDCPGPKLKPFDFQGLPKIVFLEYIGEGAHALVVKVRISGRIYALKVFRWLSCQYSIGPAPFAQGDDREALSALYEYMDPFSAECRAFGRLEESGHQDLAVPCFGYALMDKAHETAMIETLGIGTWYARRNEDIIGCIDDEENRERFRGQRGALPPLRCIVKAFGQGTREAPVKSEEGSPASSSSSSSSSFGQKMARQMLRDIIKLQKLGILLRQDVVGIRQLVDGRMCGFGAAITMPHFITSPELNPNLTPAMTDAMRKCTFEHCMGAYLDFDFVVSNWNFEHAREHKSPGHRISVQAYPGGQGCFQARKRYDLRREPAQQDRLYTFVDPRKYGWKAGPVDAAAANGRVRSPKLRRSERILSQNQASHRAGLESKGLVTPRTQPLTGRPDMWYYEYEDKDSRWAKRTGLMKQSTPHSLTWTYENGYFSPVRYHGVRII